MKTIDNHFIANQALPLIGTITKTAVNTAIKSPKRKTTTAEKPKALNFLTEEKANEIAEEITDEVTYKQWQGKNRQYCLQHCHDKGYQVIQFAHWLAIPTLKILLSFRKTLCVEVSTMKPLLS